MKRDSPRPTRCKSLTHFRDIDARYNDKDAKSVFVRESMGDLRVYPVKHVEPKS